MAKFTVDRIEGDIVVLLQKGNELIQKDIPIGLFPKEIKEGDIVEEINENDELRYSILKIETDLARDKAEKLLNKLKNKHK